jgi:hypothetical protein
VQTAESMQNLAVVTAKSFGDFVIAHSALHRVEAGARDRIRLIACSHVSGLGAVLPEDVSVTFLALPEDRVPALFDIRKRGIPRAVGSALWLRRALGKLARRPGESLVFEGLGVRERLIAGRWPLAAVPRRRNIYETYAQFLTEQGLPVKPAVTAGASGPVRSVGIFPESRLAAKTLDAATLWGIAAQVMQAGLEARVFLLEGDPSATPPMTQVVRVPRNFASLTQAIASVDCVVSADSLPAHLAEYIAKPVFVAAAFANEYWLPGGCFTHGRWGLFHNAAEFRASLGRFLGNPATARAA